MTAVITVIAVVLVFEVCCLVDIAHAKEVRRLDRETWALICLVTQHEQRQIDRAVKVQKICEQDHQGPATETYERQV